MNQKFHQTVLPIFRLLLFRGTPIEVNGSIPTIVVLAVLLVLLVWLGLPSGDSISPDRDVASDVRMVYLAIPILAYAIATLMILTVLNIRRFSDRFPKTISACLGLLLLFQMGAFTLRVFLNSLPTTFEFISGLLGWVLIFWLVGALGYVFAHAFSLKLYQGVLAALVISLISAFLSSILTGMVLPGEVGTLIELQRLSIENSASD